MPSDAQLKMQLRTLLGADAQDEPLPDNLLRVPDRWVRPGVSGASLGVLATAVSAIALVTLVAILLRGAPQFRIGGPSTADIGSAIGVPAGQVLATDDGWVAVRSFGDRLEVLVARQKGAQILSKVVGSTVMVGDSRGSRIAGETVACSTADQMRERFIVYAHAGFGTRDPAKWIVNPEPSHIATSGGFLVAVFTSDGWAASGGQPNAVHVDAYDATVAGHALVNRLGLLFLDPVSCRP